MEDSESLAALGLALALGLLIGFEREQSAPDDPEERRRSFVGGARTFPIVALLGGLSMLLGVHFGLGLVLLAFAVVAALLALAYWSQMREGGDRGLTTEVAFLATFLLGALATSRGVIEPISRRALTLAAVAVIVTVILSLKPRIHALADAATKDDLFATLKFLIVAVVILPLLPNQTFGPLQVLNPRKIGLMVALIAGIDFVGYVALRVLGPGRGLGLTGIVGGLASSTAVTLSMSQRAKSTPALAPSCALAVVTASTIMVPRVLLEVALVNRALLPVLGLPLAGMAVGGTVAAGFLYSRSRQTGAKSETLSIDNPFELSAALKWGLVFTLVLFAARLASSWLGDSGAYVAAIVAGLSDVDAITLSMASLAKSGAIDSRVAVTSIMLGAAANTLVKAGMATVIAGWAFGRTVVLAFALTLLGGAAGLVALWLG
ncbi:MAG: DUF4010 domain-containing protein [Myxococcales bacterium]|nr:DUF4010 domain-containing protein [Myxococcales bacterium]